MTRRGRSRIARLPGGYNLRDPRWEGIPPPPRCIVTRRKQRTPSPVSCLVLRLQKRPRLREIGSRVMTRKMLTYCPASILPRGSCREWMGARANRCCEIPPASAPLSSRRAPTSSHNHLKETSNRSTYQRLCCLVLSIHPPPPQFTRLDPDPPRVLVLSRQTEMSARKDLGYRITGALSVP